MVGRPGGDVIGGRAVVPLNDFCEKDQEFLAYKRQLWKEQGRVPDAFDVRETLVRKHPVTETELFARI